MGNAMAIAGRSLPPVRGESFQKPSAEAIEQRRGVFENRLSPEELARNKNMADEVNKSLRARGKKYGEAMGKDDFMKLLVTEIRHQDPTQPMADREFIAQMTQFSSLEQMQNINTSMSSMYSNARNSEAYGLIGKRIEALDPVTNRAVAGDVSHVVREGSDVRIVVNGAEVPLDNVHAVYPAAEQKDSQSSNQRPASQNGESADTLKQTQSAYDILRAQAVRSYDATGSVPAQSAPAQRMNQE